MGTTAPPLTDEQLAARFRESGDPDVLGELYGRYLDLVYGLCLQYLRDGGRAEDAAMDIYEQLHGKLRAHEVTHFRPWLYRLARNHCLMILRRSASQLSRDSVSVPTYAGADVGDMQIGDLLHQDGVEDEVLARERSLEALEACREALSEDQGACIRRFYLEGASYAEIAEERGLAVGKVRSHLQNGRRNLKKCVERKTSHVER